MIFDKIYIIITIENPKEKVKREAQNMKNAETIARVHTHTHTHTRNLLKNKQAKKLALIMIYKADYFKSSLLLWC